jgi:hypothetical protein
MTRAYRIAGFGLLTSAAVTLAMAGMATAERRGGFGMQDMFGQGGQGGGFAMTFATLDADGNGLITEEDLRALAEAKFTEMDLDGSGTLGPDELAAVMEARMTERMGGRMGERMGDRGPQRADPVSMMTSMAERMVKARDTDGDGMLSMAELEPAKGFGRMIDRFDTDDDNAISQAEFDEAKAEMSDRKARRGDRGDRGGWGDRGDRGGHGGMGDRGGKGGHGGDGWRGGKGN